jgi:hypothetical protein
MIYFIFKINQKFAPSLSEPNPINCLTQCMIQAIISWISRSKFFWNFLAIFDMWRNLTCRKCSFFSKIYIVDHRSSGVVKRHLTPFYDKNFFWLKDLPLLSKTTFDFWRRRSITFWLHLRTLPFLCPETYVDQILSPLVKSVMSNRVNRQTDRQTEKVLS